MKVKRIIAVAAAFGLLAAVLHAQTTSPPKLAATLKPAAPVTGDNTLDVVATDSSGAPVLGLKFTSTVLMTSMNMGTAHPPVKETGKGHYKVTVGFLMDGPWRVTLKAGSLTKSFDFVAGSKQPWKMPAETKASVISKQPESPTKPTEPPVPVKPDEKKPDQKKPDEQKPEVKPPETPVPPAKKTDEPAVKPEASKAGDHTDHGAMKMPQLLSSGSTTVSGDEDWSTATGFGRNEAMVGMMIQMMVGGSGMEGMKMAAMKMDFGDANFMPGEAGGMPAMDMDGTKAVKATAKLSGSPKTGENRLEITVVDAKGKPVEKAKITLSVAMTSMDMGTTHPSIKELGKGKYSASVGFSMVGPWRVTAKVEAGGKSATFTFDFNAK